MNEFNSSIKQKRTQLGLTQKQLAKLIEVSVNTISKWETGTMPRNIAHVIKMGEVFCDKEFADNLHKDYI